MLDLCVINRLKKKYFLTLETYSYKTIPEPDVLNYEQTLFIRCYFDQIKFFKISRHFAICTNKFCIRSDKFPKFYLTTIYHSHFFLPHKFLLAQISSLQVIYMLLFLLQTLATLKLEFTFNFTFAYLTQVYIFQFNFHQ